MRKGLKRIIAVMVSAALLTGMLYTNPGARASSYDAQIEAAKKKQEELEEMIENSRKRKEEFEKKQAESKAYLESLSGDISKVEEYIREVDMKLEEVNARLNDLEYKISEKEDELAKTKIELADAIERQQEQYATMKKRIRYTYENGSETILETLAGSHNIADFLNRVEYRVSIAEYDNTLYDRYKAATALVVATKAYLEESIKNLEELKAEAEAEKASCEELAAKKGEQLEAYMARYQMEDELLFTYISEIDNTDKSIQDLYNELSENAKKQEDLRKAAEEEARRIAEELERKRREEAARRAKEEAERRAREAAARAAAEQALKNQRLKAAEGITMTAETSLLKMIWPLPGDGRTFSGFGPRKPPCPGATSFHNGVDIGGEYGATIVAVLAGTVTIATYNSSAGNYVGIDHGNGVSTRYCHASKLLVKPGEYVLQGQPIALVGSTGVSTGPHLHFAVLINGQYVDPMKYIKYTN
jgi:murein DD-endopeptidase MepM/ murein hydrolase activator NlpD